MAGPTMNSSRTGRGHSFLGISSGNRVWILLGFSKSPAIFARSLLLEMPMFTVKPSSRRIRFRSISAAARGGPYRRLVPVISAQASSMEYCSTTGATSRSSRTNCREASTYRP